MNNAELYKKALAFEFLSVEEGLYLFENAPLTELMYVAGKMREEHVPHGKVTWQIDRNVNTTNVCIANCKFCNFLQNSRPCRSVYYRYACLSPQD